jgi:hypothetical protein
MEIFAEGAGLLAQNTTGIDCSGSFKFKSLKV